MRRIAADVSFRLRSAAPSPNSSSDTISVSVGQGIEHINNNQWMVKVDIAPDLLVKLPRNADNEFNPAKYAMSESLVDNSLVKAVFAIRQYNWVEKMSLNSTLKQ